MAPQSRQGLLDHHEHLRRPQPERTLHQSLPDGSTVDYTYGAADQYGSPEIESLKQASHSGTIYVDHDPTGASQVLTANDAT